MQKFTQVQAFPEKKIENIPSPSWQAMPIFLSPGATKLCSAKLES